MFGIREKLSFGFGGLFLILCLVGIQSIILLAKLGESIDVILRENYRSVIACQDMKEALERMDSAALFTLLRHDSEGKSLIEENRRKFAAALKVELNNITLAGELEQATGIQNLFREYKRTLDEVTDSSKSLDSRRDRYFKVLLPLFSELKRKADRVLLMNQANMNEANERARHEATSARHRMVSLLAIAAVLAWAFVVMTGKWILRPITLLTESAEEIRKGNLDLVVHSDSNDEIGRLSYTFNEMAGSLREIRRSDRAKLLRVQRSTEQAFRHLPQALAVANLAGKIEIATETAKSDFELVPDSQIENSSVERLGALFREAVGTAQPALSGNGQVLIQRFIRGEERFFRPIAVPILDREKLPTGVILILDDVTQEHREQELKKGVIATVSHQLKTPLTSIRMTIHVLLEERLGKLTEKQVELLLGAREEGERLYSITEQLLQLSRIESGKLAMNVESVSPLELVFEAKECFSRSAQDSGIALNADLPQDLPPVQTDRLLVHQVFDNLLSNALKYTEPGGQVTMSARADAEFVWFSVADTGKGIPAQYLQRILEQFFRVPGQASGTGVGLGLAIVKQIVDAHGGLVSVESQEGKGSTFTFSLRRSLNATQEVEHV